MPNDKSKMFESLVNVTSDGSDSTGRATRYRDEDQKGHAIHFLERLDRASGTQAELALQLYNDPEVLRYILNSITIPEEFDRVAVSLHEADKGPYLVATCKGRFVTCLGEGMKIGGLYLLNYSRLLSYMEKKEESRRRRKLAVSLVGERHQLKKLFMRILNKSDNVTREEMLAISSMQPALKVVFIEMLCEFMSNNAVRSKLLIRRKRFTKKDRSLLHKYYGEYRAIGHLALLASMSGPGGIEDVMEDNVEVLFHSFLMSLFTGDINMLFKLSWFIGKMGKSFLPVLKRGFLEPRFHEEWVLSFLGLLVIGLRHSKTRPKVLTILNGLVDALKNYNTEIKLYIECFNIKDLMSIVAVSLIKEEKGHEHMMNTAKRICFKAHQPCDLPAPYKWKEATDVPEDLAATFIVNGRQSFSENAVLLNICMAFAPWLARCDAMDFYHPYDYFHHVEQPWKPEDAITLIDQDKRKRGVKAPVKVASTPNRNDPCSCGSGKKYKRCCLLK